MNSILCLAAFAISFTVVSAVGGGFSFGGQDVPGVVADTYGKKGVIDANSVTELRKAYPKLTTLWDALENAAATKNYAAQSGANLIRDAVIKNVSDKLPLTNAAMLLLGGTDKNNDLAIQITGDEADHFVGATNIPIAQLKAADLDKNGSVCIDELNAFSTKYPAEFKEGALVVTLIAHFDSDKNLVIDGMEIIALKAIVPRPGNKTYTEIDANRSQSLCATEIRGALHESNFKILIFCIVATGLADENGNGQVDLENPRETNALRILVKTSDSNFKSFDSDNSNSLSAHELCAVATQTTQCPNADGFYAVTAVKYGDNLIDLLTAFGENVGQ